MKFKYFLSVFLAVSLVFSHITFSERVNSAPVQTPWWAQSIPELALISEMGDVEQEIYDLSIAKQRFNSLEETYRSIQDLQSQDRFRRERALDRIVGMQEEIRTTLDKNNEEKSEIETEIAFIEQEMQTLRVRKSDTEKILKSLYANGYASTLATEKSVSLHSLLLGEKFDENTQTRESNRLLKGTGVSLISRQKSLQASLDELEASMLEKKKAQESVLAHLENSKKDLEEAQSLQESLLGKTLNKQESTRKDLATILKKKKIIDTTFEKKLAEKKAVVEASFQAKITELEGQLSEELNNESCTGQNNENCSWVNSYIAAEKQLFEKGTTIDSFAWPVDSEQGFGYYFRDPSYYKTLGIHHEGVDILVAQSKPVYSMAGGYVILRERPNRRSAGLLAIKHPGGYISVYVGITPSADLKLFSFVDAKSKIGITRAFTDHTGQNNIHVELYKNSYAVDPLEKLDFSNLSSDFIPKKYGWKYMDDLTKAGKTFNYDELHKKIGFFAIEGKTEAERQSRLLSNNATTDFSDRDVWIEESLAERIDPSFVMCVGFAESTLGKNLATDGNIGNVGNTDDGDRVAYTTPRSGIRAISSVVNNNWLGKYKTIDQLSGWGSRGGPIYASSKSNWHENITKCLSALKGHYVGNQASFRLSHASLILYQQEGFKLDSDS